MGRIALNITDIANMIYLADGVLSAARAFFFYDEDGNPLHGKAAINEQIEKDKANGLNGDLIDEIFGSAGDITAAVETTPEDILKMLAPIRKRILGMFRNGAVPCDIWVCYKLYAAPEVPDEWLLDLFAMRVRDRMIAYALHKDKEKFAKIVEEK